MNNLYRELLPHYTYGDHAMKDFIELQSLIDRRFYQISVVVALTIAILSCGLLCLIGISLIKKQDFNALIFIFGSTTFLGLITFRLIYRPPLWVHELTKRVIMWIDKKNKRSIESALHLSTCFYEDMAIVLNKIPGIGTCSTIPEFFSLINKELLRPGEEILKEVFLRLGGNRINWQSLS